jgi:hypothetical protein
MAFELKMLQIVVMAGEVWIDIVAPQNETLMRTRNM